MSMIAQEAESYYTVLMVFDEAPCSHQKTDDVSDTVDLVRRAIIAACRCLRRDDEGMVTMEKKVLGRVQY